MLFNASAACHFTCTLAPIRTPTSPLIRGGVLSIQNGLLSRCAVSASVGGLPGASDAVTRIRYSPSGKAVESHERYFSVTLSLSSFHSVSLTPRISTVNISGSPLGSCADQRAPTKPLAACIAGVVSRVICGPPLVVECLPSGGSDSVDWTTENAETEDAGKR